MVSWCIILKFTFVKWFEFYNLYVGQINIVIAFKVVMWKLCLIMSTNPNFLFDITRLLLISNENCFSVSRKQ